jgi:hypothetical protein
LADGGGDVAHVEGGGEVCAGLGGGGEGVGAGCRDAYGCAINYWEFGACEWERKQLSSRMKLWSSRRHRPQVANGLNKATSIILGLYQDVEVTEPSEAVDPTAGGVLGDCGRGGTPIIAPSITRAEAGSLNSAATFRAPRGEMAFKSK